MYEERVGLLPLNQSSPLTWKGPYPRSREPFRGQLSDVGALPNWGILLLDRYWGILSCHSILIFVFKMKFIIIPFVFGSPLQYTPDQLPECCNFSVCNSLVESDILFLSYLYLLTVMMSYLFIFFIICFTSTAITTALPFSLLHHWTKFKDHTAARRNEMSIVDNHDVFTTIKIV